MPQRWKKTLSKGVITQLKRYAFVGFIGGLINIAITTTLCGIFNIHYYITLPLINITLDFWVAFFNGVGILVAFLFNFYWNRRWTFKK